MRIVPARDGGLARLRLPGGALSADAARAIARAASRCGSGTIDVTNRANLQLRGIRDDAHGELIAIALDAGLGPSSEGGDDLRNIMLSPLASDATRALAARIVEAMQNDAALRALSPKFALQLDCGESLAMLDHSHDLWFASVDACATHFAFGFAGSMPHRADDAPALGVIARDDMLRFVMAALHAFVALASGDEHRMRDLLTRIDAARLLDTFDAPILPASPAWRRAPSDASLRLGAHREENAVTYYVGAQTRLGRLDASTLDTLADLVDNHAQSRLLITPWQSVMIPGVAIEHVPNVLRTLDALGLATDARQPFARIVACAGSQGCAKSRADTKADAHRLAPVLPPDADVHLSGCERSCAAAHPVDTTLLAVAPGRYDLYRATRIEARDLTIEEAAAWLARSTTHA
jgi:precorrin-3B synthase